MSELVEAADEALYRAKRAGKNRVYAGTEQVTQM
jgi:PleD family two-component response regulator